MYIKKISNLHQENNPNHKPPKKYTQNPKTPPETPTGNPKKHKKQYKKQPFYILIFVYIYYSSSALILFLIVVSAFSDKHCVYFSLSKIKTSAYCIRSVSVGDCFFICIYFVYICVYCVYPVILPKKKGDGFNFPSPHCMGCNRHFGCCTAIPVFQGMWHCTNCLKYRVFGR